MKSLRKSVLYAALAVSTMAVMQAPASAQQFPSKDIAIVVPFGAGGPNDVVARVIAPKLSKELGVNVLVENRPGASTQVAVEHVGRQAADGHTLMLASVNVAMLPVANKSYTGDIGNDLVAVMGLYVAPLLIVASSELPVKTFKEFVDYGKANPGKINWAVVGAADVLGQASLEEMTGIKAVRIPYPGQGQVVTSLLSKEAQAAWFYPGDVKQHVESGAVRPMAITGKDRVASFPDVPTVIESGYPDYLFVAFNGVMVKKGTPQPVIDKLHEAMKVVLQDSEVRAKLVGYGFQITGTPPAEHTKFWKSEAAKWLGVAERTGVKLN